MTSNARKIISFNENWTFTAPQQNPVNVNLPHTWNNLDGQDGNNDYLRCACIYEKSIPNLHLAEDEQAYMEFQGSSQSTKITFKKSPEDNFAFLIESGKCPFSTLRANITTVADGSFFAKITVDNSPSDEIYPQNADFTFFGGIYRPVNIITVKKNHFSLMDSGSPGAQIHVYPEKNKATVKIKPFFEGNCSKYTLRIQLLDASNTIVAQTETKPKEEEYSLEINNPHLWNGLQDPYLYRARLQLLENSSIHDEIEMNFGVRTFFIDPEKGFFLNGKSYPLRGVSRHQDRLNQGWAITEKDHNEDFKLILEMGANSIRLAHYQHSQYFYDLCDRYGMVVWAEIPFITSVLDHGDENLADQMTCLIKQNMHHASIFCWSLSNEVICNGIPADGIYTNHVRLAEICKNLDNTRLKVLAHRRSVAATTPINNLIDAVGYNLYLGWYNGTTEDNGWYLDALHSNLSSLPLGLTEYGAEARTCFHSEDPIKYDYSEEYQAIYHEKMLEIIAKRPYLWCTYVWNMFDFAVDARDEGQIKGRNNKGLCSYDRKTKKDSYYIYKAWWSDQKFVHICSSRFENRASDTIDVKVYSNCNKVTLLVNGHEKETLTGNHIFIFKNIPIEECSTVITATSEECKDEATFKRVKEPDKSYNVAQIKEIRNWKGISDARFSTGKK